MKLHRCLGHAVLVALLCAPLVAHAEDAGSDAAADAAADASAPVDSGAADTGAPPDTTSSSSGSPPITVDPGGKVPGSGQTEEVPQKDDSGCNVSPASMASPSALVLALAALWFVRRKKR